MTNLNNFDKETMLYIYVYTNKINGHQYVGQTNSLNKRYNGHLSDSYNKNSHSYNYPLSCAIRKYGIKNFDYEVLEEVSTREEANEREIYWIDKLKSHVSHGGYNISLGGNSSPRGKMTWDELKDCGKLFTGEEIEDIQKRLLNNQEYEEIIDYYSPRLSTSFLSNINNGYNYNNPNLKYPLKKEFHKGSFSKEEMKEIKEEIKQGIIYKDIAKKHNIKSMGFISGINSGKYYHDDKETYPLFLKSCADKRWIKDCIYDALFTSDTYVNIAKKYNKSYSTIKKLCQGRANKQDKLLYPLRQHLKENQELFKKYYQS